jgi:hypothetical protein
VDGAQGAAIFVLGSMAEHSCRCGAAKGGKPEKNLWENGDFWMKNLKNLWEDGDFWMKTLKNLWENGDFWMKTLKNLWEDGDFWMNMVL